MVLRDVYSVDGFQTTLAGKNGGGDPYRTDGNLGVGVIGSTGATAVAVP